MVLAVVTGASRGLGFENAKSLAALGYDIVMVAKDSSRLSQAKESLQRDHPNQHFTPHTVDLEDMQATRNVVEMISQQLVAPELLILAHGVMSDKMSKTLKTNDAEWRRVLAINLDSVFTLVNGAPYRISKAGVNALVRNLAHETGLGSRGVLVDAVCPNHSRTDMGGAEAPRSAEEGAACALWLATREFNTGDTTGVLWEDNQIVEW